MTIKKIATKAYKSSATALWRCGLAAVLVLTGCSALPAAPTRPVLYDFGPGPLATVPTDRRAPLAPLALADVEAPGLPEGSNAVYYRLAYTDGQHLRPYSQARWSQPPAQLVQQRHKHLAVQIEPHPLRVGAGNSRIDNIPAIHGIETAHFRDSKQALAGIDPEIVRFCQGIIYRGELLFPADRNTVKRKPELPVHNPVLYISS